MDVLGSPVLNSPCRLCGRKAALELQSVVNSFTAMMSFENDQ